MAAGPGSDERPGPRHRAGPTDIADPVIRQEVRRAFVWLGMAALLALAVFLSQSLLVIFGGIVFAALIDGGARLLGRVLPSPRGWRVAIVLIAAVLFLAWTARFAGSQIAQQAAELPATIQTQFFRALDWLRGHGIVINVGNVQELAPQAMGGIGQVTRAVGGLIGAFTTLFLILVLGIYFALEPRLYRRGVAWMMPADRRAYFEGTAQIMGFKLRRLLFGRLLGMTVEGVATWLMLQVYGVPMAALLGLITGLLAFLPNIGAPISGFIMVMVGFSGGFDMGIYTIVVYLVVQTVDGYLIVPMIARKTADLPPALVLAAQLIMGVLFGILGLALADPLVAMIKVWLERGAARHDPAAAGMDPDLAEPGPEPAPDAA
ncbi:AI-2E family transporter [Novosphingobium album (ex Liu et al. 2023)]|uniref:AI-2E family transporter n=1 Tax=Novosphingobium album (ex Liu et al. 2023) TaxID=3031130 RepID=A0ABT5WTE3_9SPHN|nr:AI-2E family transporter [Novosphingobium album (ex Liu et al. 2023)]MDE8652918.1 AI-2E family transporter [Novosphingobium album (ex Liu et al. 2023)]